MSAQQSALASTVIFLLLFLETTQCLLVDYPVRTKFVSPPVKGIKPDTFGPISGELVLASPEDGCSLLDNSDALDGKIVLVLHEDACSPTDKAYFVASSSSSVLAMVIAKDVASNGVLSNANWGTESFNGSLPTVEVDPDQRDVFLNWLAEEKQVFLTLDSNDPNVFIHMMTKEFFGISVQYSLLAFHVVVLVVAISKLYHFVALFGPEISIPQVCLFMEILQILLRILWYLDPWMAHGIWNWPTQFTLLYWSIPFTFSSMCLIAFYWAEITSQYKPVSDSAPNLRRMRWPFAVSMCILWGYQLLVIVTYTALPQLLVIVFIRDIILVIFSVFVGFIFLIYGFRVIKILHRFQNRHNAMQKMTVLVVGLGSVNLVTCLLALSLALPLLWSDTFWYVTVCTLTRIAAATMTWMIVMLLEPSRAQYSQKIRSSMLGCCSTRMMLLDTSTTESGKRELSSSLISFHHSSSVDHV